MSEIRINWPAHVRYAAPLLLLPAVSLLLILLFFWWFPLFLPNEGKNDVSSEPDLLVDVSWPMFNGRNEEFAVQTLLHASLNLILSPIVLTLSLNKSSYGAEITTLTSTFSSWNFLVTKFKPSLASISKMVSKLTWSFPWICLLFVCCLLFSIFVYNAVV